MQETNAPLVYDHQDLDVYNSPILVSDATSMFRRDVPSNEKPYVQAVIKLNNDKVDRWERDMLKNICGTNGTLPSGRVELYLKIFEDGFDIPPLMEMLPMLPRASQSQIEYWIDFFRKPITEIVKYGWLFPFYGWQILKNELLIQTSIEKDRLIYHSSSELALVDTESKKQYDYYDPVRWYEQGKGEKNLIEEKFFPFWSEEAMKDTEEKMSALMNYRVKPDMKKIELIKNKNDLREVVTTLFQRYVSENMRPYDHAVATYSNNLVNQWLTTMAESLQKTKKGKGVKLDEILEWWTVFEDTLNIPPLAKNMNKFPRPSKEQFDKLMSTLTKSINDVYSYGKVLMILVSQCVMTETRFCQFDDKWELCFDDVKCNDGLYNSVQVFKKIKKNHSTLKFRSDERVRDELIRDISEKMAAIVSRRIKPSTT